MAHRVHLVRENKKMKKTRTNERIRLGRPEGSGETLLGVAIHSYDPAFVEIVARVGFHVLWIEMEHAFVSFAQAADLCRIASGVGLLTLIRIPDARRDNVLKAAECGPDIIDLPMVETLQDLHQFVSHARFEPRGQRGFFGSSRPFRYGLIDSLATQQQEINSHLMLMFQIETETAARNAGSLCEVPEVDAVFLGLGDLSMSLGVPGDYEHPKLKESAKQVIQVAKGCGKQVAVAVPPGSVGYWSRLGVDFLFCGNNRSCLSIGAKHLLEKTREAVLAAACQKSVK